MKKRRILCLFLALVMAIGCTIPAFAEVKTVSLQINTANHIKLSRGDKVTGTFSTDTIASSFIVMVKGFGKPDIQITYRNSHGVETIALNKSADIKGFMCETCTVLWNLSKEFTVQITSPESVLCDFDFWIIDADGEYSGLSAYPDTSKVYKEDIDVKFDGTAVTYLTDAPSFAGAVFSFRDGNNAEIVSLNGNDVQCVLLAPYYNVLTNKIVYDVKAAAAFGRNSTITYNVTPNPIAIVGIESKANILSSYHFGKDGTLKGNIFKYSFRPEIDFTDSVLTVTYKDTYGGASESLTVQKDANGYYVTSTVYGRLDVTYEAEATKNQTRIISAAVYVKAAGLLLPIQIEKADFFEFIGIWFGLLFGKYK